MKSYLSLRFTPVVGGLTWSGPIICALAGALILAANLSAAAQEPHYAVRGLNFDLWCQQQAKLPPIRCEKRTAIDENAYDAYRDKIDPYEVPFLQQRSQQRQIERSIMNFDPEDNLQGTFPPLP